MKRDLIKEEQLTSKIDYVMTIAGTLLRAPFEVSMLYFSETVKILYLKDPLYELIIGNIPGARAPYESDETWCVHAAVVTGAQLD